MRSRGRRTIRSSDFLVIPASAADAAAVNPKGFKTLLANALITFFIAGNPVFSRWNVMCCF